MDDEMILCLVAPFSSYNQPPTLDDTLAFLRREVDADLSLEGVQWEVDSDIRTREWLVVLRRVPSVACEMIENAPGLKVVEMAGGLPHILMAP